jgi:hypothetical protein
MPARRSTRAARHAWELASTQLQLLDRQQEWTLPTAVQAQLHKGLYGAGPDHLRTGRGAERRGHSASQQEQHIRRRVRRRHAERLERLVHLGCYGLRGIGRGDLPGALEESPQGQVRGRVAVGHAPPVQGGDPGGAEPLVKLREQARLANPGMPHHSHHLAAPALDLCPQGLQHGKLVLPSHKPMQDALPTLRQRGGRQPYRQHLIGHGYGGRRRV